VYVPTMPTDLTKLPRLKNTSVLFLGPLSLEAWARIFADPTVACDDPDVLVIRATAPMVAVLESGMMLGLVCYPLELDGVWHMVARVERRQELLERAGVV
jgi:hypothetical protein